MRLEVALWGQQARFISMTLGFLFLNLSRASEGPQPDYHSLDRISVLPFPASTRGGSMGSLMSWPGPWQPHIFLHCCRGLLRPAEDVAVSLALSVNAAQISMASGATPGPSARPVV